jgi:hypothetical protein
MIPRCYAPAAVRSVKSRKTAAARTACKPLARLVSMTNPGRSSWSLCTFMKVQILPVSVLAKRKPRLLFRLVGVFLLRLAERSLCGLLFQEPPRLTRLAQGICQGRERPSAAEIERIRRFKR